VRRHLAPTLLLCACATSVPPDETDTDAARKTDLVAANDLVVVADTPAPVDAAVVLDAPALPDVAPPRDLPVVMDLPALPDVQRVDALVDVPPRADIVDAPAVLDAPRACGEALPAGWPTGWSVAGHNPVLVAARGSALQGRDNVYAPEIHRDGALWVMWYGAQASDGGDRIHVAVSRDGVTWRRHPRDDAPAAALERGSSNHVNDPSVVRAGDRWRMYYTDAPTAENDRIWLAESTSLTGFTRVREVLAPGAPGAWDAEKVGRPAVLLENGVYRMWYDGTANGRRHVGLATSTDGVTFTRHPANPVFLDAGAVDVKRVGGVYVMLREAGDGTWWATSDDGLCWRDRGRLFARSGADYDRFGQVTPFLQVEGDRAVAVWFGGASVMSWDRNRIAVAWPAGGTTPAGGGCTGCTAPGLSCAQACHGAGFAAGTCGQPGSSDPGQCCACVTDGCEGCRGDAADCHEACVRAGNTTGWCGVSGSTDPSRCCVCVR
jgi:hypothetical protein